MEKLLHEDLYKITCAPMEDSDQPGYSHNLIIVFTVSMKRANLSNAAHGVYNKAPDRDLGCVRLSVILLVLSFHDSFKPCDANLAFCICKSSCASTQADQYLCMLLPS